MDGTLVVMVLAAALGGVAVIRALAHLTSAAFPGVRRPAWLPSAAAAVAGAGLVAVGYAQAGQAAPAADADFAEYVRAKGGSLVSAPGFPGTYRQAAAGGHLVQAVLVGGAGLVLLGVGVAGLVRPSVAPPPPRCSRPRRTMASRNDRAPHGGAAEHFVRPRGETHGGRRESIGSPVPHSKWLARPAPTPEARTEWV